MNSSILLCALMTMAVMGATAAAKPIAAPEGVEIQQDVAYLAPERTERLDLYLPAGRASGTRSPAVLIIHGGGWTISDKAAGREINIGTTLAKAGYVCASINYQMTSPRWPTALHDCKNAVRFLRKNADKYGIDVDHIGVIGGSAGGHLSMMVAFTGDNPDLAPPAPYPGISDKVHAVVDLYGIADLRTWQKTDETGKPTGEFRPGGTALIEASVTAKPDLWKIASPVEYIRQGIPPVLILQGTADTIVDRDQSINLAKLLKEKGLDHQLILIDGIGHTFDLQKWNGRPLPYDLRPIVTGFFDKYLKKANAAAR